MRYSGIAEGPDEAIQLTEFEQMKFVNISGQGGIRLAFEPHGKNPHGGLASRMGEDHGKLPGPSDKTHTAYPAPSRIFHTAGRHYLVVPLFELFETNSINLSTSGNDPTSFLIFSAASWTVRPERKMIR
jgi:hypothetical protein